MVKVLQKNNLGDCILKNAKKKLGDQPIGKRGNSHALIAINSSSNAWILDSSASYHMAATDSVLSFISTCTSPPILMGDDIPTKALAKGK